MIRMGVTAYTIEPTYVQHLQIIIIPAFRNQDDPMVGDLCSTRSYEC